MAKKYDVAVIGAGAAGMMCAAVAAGRGKSVVLIDHADKLAEKIRISGGGRCNFTNLDAGPQNFLSENPHFCKSALSRYTPQDFLALLKRHRIAFHEKHKGQLFCDDSAEQIIAMLKDECASGGVHWRMPCKIESVARQLEADEGGFLLLTDSGEITCTSLVIATGGLSIPKIGATDFAFRLAQQFALKIVAPRPALVPLTFDAHEWAPFAELAGIALPVEIETGNKDGKDHKKEGGKKGGARAGRFREDLLFTHRGLSGPAVLQISSYWQEGAALRINLLPDIDAGAELIAGKGAIKKNLGNVVAQWLPARLADRLIALAGLQGDARLADLSDKQCRQLGLAINGWVITPNGSEGYRKAEVTLGGIDTRELSQQSMMVSKVPGLYFIGECIDVTGWLGGYNFQWAWASGVAAGQHVE